jgi:hypothetical protein
MAERWSMYCPKCKAKTSTADSRPHQVAGKKTSAWRRRRVCPGCDHRFSTLEVLAEPDVEGHLVPQFALLKPRRLLVTIDEFGKLFINQVK